MISLPVAFTFVAATAVLAITPGPNMSLIVANTLAGGARQGFVTLAGALTGNALLLVGVILAMSSLMIFMSEWFDVIRWIGAIYLLGLGLRQLRASGRRDVERPRPVPAASAYIQGLIVSMSNPKVLLFHGAFLPQFIDPARDATGQLQVLAVVFVLVLGLTRSPLPELDRHFR
jgi:homoserine/homoserine lactone efflux protein